jgi:hypothetical protein
MNQRCSEVMLKLLQTGLVSPVRACVTRINGGGMYDGEYGPAIPYGIEIHLCFTPQREQKDLNIFNIYTALLGSFFSYSSMIAEAKFLVLD